WRERSTLGSSHRERRRSSPLSTSSHTPRTRLECAFVALSWVPGVPRGSLWPCPCVLLFLRRGHDATWASVLGLEGPAVGSITIESVSRGCSSVRQSTCLARRGSGAHIPTAPPTHHIHLDSIPYYSTREHSPGSKRAGSLSRLQD